MIISTHNLYSVSDFEHYCFEILDTEFVCRWSIIIALKCQGQILGYWFYLHLWNTSNHARIQIFHSEIFWSCRFNSPGINRISLFILQFTQQITSLYIYLHNHPFVYRLHDGRMTVIFYSRSGEGAKFILLSENGVNLNFRNNMSTWGNFLSTAWRESYILGLV